MKWRRGTPALVLFDSGCGLCCWSVGFIAKRDRRGRFRFAALGTTAADEALRRHWLPPGDDTLVLEEGDGRAYTHSTAVLRIFRGLSGAWPLVYAFVLVPRPARDAAYALVARRRHRLFGGTCELTVPPGRLLE